MIFLSCLLKLKVLQLTKVPEALKSHQDKHLSLEIQEDPSSTYQSPLLLGVE